MSWYNYLFAAFAVVGCLGAFFVGAPAYARQKNTAGVLVAFALTAFWAGIFYWNVFA